jgi:hypothetical protein
MLEKIGGNGLDSLNFLGQATSDAGGAAAGVELY